MLLSIGTFSLAHPRRSLSLPLPPHSTNRALGDIGNIGVGPSVHTRAKDKVRFE
jgi:hypothetical protein